MSDIRDDIQSAVEVLRGEGDGGGVEAPAVAPSTGDVAGGDGVQPDSEVAPGGVEAQPSPDAAETAKRARDAAGKFTKAEAAAKAAEAKAPGTKEVAPAPVAKVAPAVDPAAPVPEAVKAPQSWKPAAREKWASLDPSVQQEITRIENDTKGALREAAESRKQAQAFKEVVAPYEGLIRASGSEPLQMIGTLLQTGAGLRHGTPQAKAQLAAKIIQEYGVPVDLLDQALAGNAPQGQPQGAYQDPRVDQLLAQIQHAGQQRSASQTQKLQSDITTFATSHEFFEDVRHDVADLMETRGRRGVAITLEDAYNLACKMHPEISGVFAQREAAKAANASQASTQRARAAASSVKSQPAGAKVAPKSGTLREDIEAAVADLQSQG